MQRGMGGFKFSIDLTDAYFHILKHKKSQNLMSLHVAVQSYQFRAVLLCIIRGPIEFTSIVKEVKLVLQNKGIHIHRYLDDWFTACSITPNLLGPV